MSDGIYSALSGAVAQQRQLDVVANNVANAATTGYQADRVAFREAVSRAPEGPTPAALRYVTVSQLTTDSTTGPLSSTGNALDLAIQGDGMFGVETPNGVRFTRAGAFRMDSEGVVRSVSGHPLLLEGSESPVQLPPNAQRGGASGVNIAADGTIRIGNQSLGRIRVEQFAPGDLEKEGLTLYAPRDGAQGQQPEDYAILQGHLEGSNVSPVSGITELIGVHRSFDAMQRVIRAFKQLDERTARELGKS